MHANLPLDSLQDSLYAWEAQLAINLYSQGQSWYDLDSASADSLAAMAQNNKLTGYVAGSISALLNRGEVRWPVPMLDSATYDSMVASIPTGQKPGRNGDAAQPEIAKANASAGFAIYPNPNNGNFIAKSDDAGTFTLYTVLGQEVQSYEVAKGNTEVNMPVGLAPGMYIGAYRPKHGQTSEVKIIYQP